MTFDVVSHADTICRFDWVNSQDNVRHLRFLASDSKENCLLFPRHPEFCLSAAGFAKLRILNEEDSLPGPIKIENPLDWDLWMMHVLQCLQWRSFKQKICQGINIDATVACAGLALVHWSKAPS